MYFPKSQIKSNLYTNGGEYVIINTNQEYIGYYFMISTGKKFIGFPPLTNESVEIITSPPQSDDPTNATKEIILEGGFDSNSDFTIIDFLSNSNTYKEILNLPTTRSLPQPYQTLPTPQNYEDKVFSRYFAKRTNELKYKEISKQTYTLLKNKDTSIAWDLYEPEKIEWEIRGDKSIIFRNNKTTITKIEQNKKWYGFSNYLKEDYTKYWKP